MTSSAKTAGCFDMTTQFLRGLLLTATLLVGAQALGADLDQAKQNGLVGERADGYLGLVDESAAEDVVMLVKSVNNKRREEYRRIAEKNDLTLEQVQALAGKKAIERTEPGAWILTNGGWRRK